MAKSLSDRLEQLQWVLSDASEKVRCISFAVAGDCPSDKLTERSENLTDILANVMAEIALIYAMEPKLEVYTRTLDFKIEAKLEEKIRKELNNVS